MIIKKYHPYLSKISFLLILLIFQSCQAIKDYTDSHKVIEFEYDNKSLLLKAPRGYCFYDKNNPLENDVIKILKEVNNSDYLELEFLFQKCQEKTDFVNNVHPLFRDTGAISFLPDDKMLKVKEAGLSRYRKNYIKFWNNIVSKHDMYSIDTINKNMIQFLKEVKKDRKIIDESTNLTIEQKNELRLVHSEIFGSQNHTFLSYKNFLDPEVALYSYHVYQLGKMTFQCASAKTLINYIPLNINLCIENKSENGIQIEETIKKYVKALMELNNDLPLD